MWSGKENYKTFETIYGPWSLGGYQEETENSRTTAKEEVKYTRHPKTYKIICECQEKNRTIVSS